MIDMNKKTGTPLLYRSLLFWDTDTSLLACLTVKKTAD